MRALARTGVKEFRDLDEVAAIYDSFKDPRRRHRRSGTWSGPSSTGAARS